MQQKGIENDPGPRGDTPHPDPQSAQSSSSWRAITINKPSPYPMERYTNRPISPYLGQSTPNRYTLGSHQQMQSLNAATADLDQILNASTFASNDGNRAWSSSLSPSTPQSRDFQDSDPVIRIAEQPKAVTPASPLSFASNFMDSIISMSYIREGSTEADSGTGNEGGGNPARRSSTTVIISGRDVVDRGGFGDPRL
jgi:hypothetical protein